MVITQVTTWTGTPGGMELLEAAAKESAPIHESLGAKNPRLMRGVVPGSAAAYYVLEFDSMEAYGAFCDAVLQHEWWDVTTAALAETYPELKMSSQEVFYDGITRKKE